MLVQKKAVSKLLHPINRAVRLKKTWEKGLDDFTNQGILARQFFYWWFDTQKLSLVWKKNMSPKGSPSAN